MGPVLPVRRSRKRYAGAFTLVELLLTLIVITLFASIAVPRAARFLAQQRAEAALRRLRIDLAWASRQARMSSAPQSVAFDPPNDRYTLIGRNDPDHPARAYSVNLSEPPYQARIVSADFGGDTTLTFNGYGAAAPGGAVVLEVGGYQKAIQVDGPLITVVDPGSVIVVPPGPVVSPPEIVQ